MRNGGKREHVGRRLNAVRSECGFTLLEVALVLVIVGFLLGGILRGQEMVTQSRIKNTVGEFNGLSAAHFTYLDRYRGTPGDEVNAGPKSSDPNSGRWRSFGAKNGNGDAQVGGTYDHDPVAVATFAPDSVSDQETLNYWWHMRLAGFIAGPRSGDGANGQPSNAFGGIVGVQNGGLGLSGLIMCSQSVPDRIASAVDTQLDDQKPDTGVVRGHDHAGGSSITVGGGASEAATVFLESGSKQYVLCKTM